MRFRHCREKTPPNFAHPAETELAELLDEEGKYGEVVTILYRRNFQRLRSKYGRPTS